MLSIESLLNGQAQQYFTVRYNALNGWSWFEHDFSLRQWSGLGAPPISGPRLDPISRILSDYSYEVSLDPRMAYGTMNFPPDLDTHLLKRSREFSEYFIDTWRPSIKDDFHYPSNILHSLVMPFVGSYTKGVYRRDHNVHHRSQYGKLVIRRDDSRSLVRKILPGKRESIDIPVYSKFQRFSADRSTDNWPDESLEAPPAGYMPAAMPVWVRYGEGLDFTNLAEFEGWDQPTKGPLIAACKSLQDRGSFPWVTVNGDEVVNLKISNFSFDWDPLNFTIRYRIEEDAYQPFSLSRIHAKWDISTGIRLTDAYHGLNPLTGPGWYRSFGVMARSFYSYTLVEGSSFVLDLPEYVQEPFSATFQPYYLSAPDKPYVQHGPYFSSEAGHAAPVFKVSPETMSYNAANEFGQYWDAKMVEIRRSAVYAFQNALENDLRILRNNYLEVLKELPEIVSLIPNVGDLVKIAKHANLKNVISGVLKLGNWVSENYLRYSFGIAPDIGVIQELNAAGPTLASRLILASKTRKKTLRGSFRFELPDSPKYHSNCVLHTTCKCTIVYPDSPLWFAIAVSYGLGLAPSTQNIWENIPFSFAVDWKTRMSDRFKAIDLQLLSIFLAVEDIQFSYKITGRFDPLSYSVDHGYALNIVADDSDVSSSFYRRDVVNFLPVLSDGHYDYFSSTRDPELGILGSLAYQLLSLGK